MDASFNDNEVLLSSTDKAKLSAGLFTQNCNLDDSGISVSVLPPRTNANNNPATLKKVKTDLKFSRVSGPYCIPVAVLKQCVPEHS